MYIQAEYSKAVTVVITSKEIACTHKQMQWILQDSSVFNVSSESVSDVFWLTASRLILYLVTPYMNICYVVLDYSACNGQRLKLTSSVLSHQLCLKALMWQSSIASVCERRLFILRLSQLSQLYCMQLEFTEKWTILIDPSLELSESWPVRTLCLKNNRN